MYKRRNLNHVFLLGSLTQRPFDTFDSLGYEYNSDGFIRNDFSQLMERENEVGYLRALSQMQEYTDKHSNEGKTFEEIVALVRPRWCQLNGEVDRFEQFCIDNAIDYYRKLKDDTTPAGKVAKEVAEGADIPIPAEAAVVK